MSQNEQPFAAVSGYWQRLPVGVHAVLTGFLVTAAGTVPWALLASLNLKYFPALPWAAPPAGIFLWLFWKYVRGAGWPQSTAATRRRNCRAHDISADIWGSAIGAGILGLWALILFQNVYGRMVHLPTETGQDFGDASTFTVFVLFVMGSLVAGITEESGMRGYMQGPLEQRYGPAVAIVVTGLVFGFMHFIHKEVTIALIPWYMGVALVYGMMAYLTGSILPSVVLHAGGNMLGGIQLLAGGRTEWQTSSGPQPLIWESGADATFWLAFLGLGVVTSAAVWAFVALARLVRSDKPQSSRG